MRRQILITATLHYLGLGLLVLAVLQGCASSKVAIKSDPSDANVYVDNQLVGKTPLTLDAKKVPYADNFELKIVKENYGTVTAIVPGGKLASLGDQISLKIPKQTDPTEITNHLMNQVVKAHQLALNKDFNGSMLILNQLIAENPKLVAPVLLKGSILFLSKNYPAANEAYHQAVELDPSNEDAARMLEFMAKNNMGGASSNSRSLSSTSAPEPTAAIEPPSQDGAQK